MLQSFHANYFTVGQITVGAFTPRGQELLHTYQIRLKLNENKQTSEKEF